MLESLPDDASLDDVQYSIYVRERIERARKAATDGKLIEQDEIETRMRRWLPLSMRQSLPQVPGRLFPDEEE